MNFSTRVAALLLLIVVLFMTGMVVPATGAAASTPSVGEEFVGPFPSWANVKRDFGAVGNGTADDTNAFQKALNSLSQNIDAGHPSVLYVPAGTYKLTQTITLSPHWGVSIIGEHPATTVIKWGGSRGAVMVALSGVTYSRVSRLTLDGSGIAGVAIDEAWSGTGPYFDNLDEYADDVFTDVGVGIRGGNLGAGGNESVIWRCKFIRNSKAGISVANFNALNWSVYDSYFEDNYDGLTNNLPNQSGGVGGNFHVYRSVFKNSTWADIDIGPVEFFAFRDNVSVGSKYFFYSNAVGSASAPLTFQNNRIINPKTRAIEVRTPGSVLLLDNTIKSSIPGTILIAEALFPPVTKSSATVISAGNTVSVAGAYQVDGKLTSLDDILVSDSSISSALPLLPPVLPNLNRTVFEVPPAANSDAIQQIVNTASSLQSGNRPVVHFPTGLYRIDKTITIPPNSDVQLLGDGKQTAFLWTGDIQGTMFRMMGPNSATMRDMFINGARAATGISAEVNDKPGARVYADQMEVENSLQDNLLIDGLDNTIVSLHMWETYGAGGAGLKVIGGPLSGAGQQTPGRVNVFQADMGQNSVAFDVSNGAKLLVEDSWHESSFPKFVTLTGKGSFVFNSGNITNMDPAHGYVGPDVSGIDIVNFSGTVALFNARMNRGSILLSGQNSGLTFLDSGMIGPIGKPIYLTNNSPNATAALINSRYFTAATGATAPTGDILSNVGSTEGLIRTTLTAIRSERLPVLTALPTGTTDVRFSRVFMENCVTGLILKSASGVFVAPTPVPPILVPPTPLPTPPPAGQTAFVSSQSSGTLRNNYSGFVGMTVTVGSNPLMVSRLGRMAVRGNSATHTIKLVQANGLDLPGGSGQVTMDGGLAGQYQYVSLPAPVALQPNTTYHLVSLETTGGDMWYDSGPVSTTKAASVSGPVYWDQVSRYVTVPNLPNNSYVSVNFTYSDATSAATVPPPSPGYSDTPLVLNFSAGALRTDYTGSLGMTFTVGASPLLVSALGRMYLAGNSGTHTIELARASEAAV